MALQRSGSYLFWGLTWDDVVEKPPSLQHPLQPNGLEAMVPVFVTRPELFSRWWPDQLLEQLPKNAYPLSPRQVQIAGSFQLLMHLLLNPSERWWQGLAQQLAQAQLQPTALAAPELMAAVEALQLSSHVEEWQAAADAQRVGQHLVVAPGLSVLNLGAMELHGQRHPAASFRAIHFDPEQAGHEPQQQAAWREWIRQSNLFQFLPHVLLSTPGWGGAEQSSAVSPYSVWLSGAPTPAAGRDGATPEQAKAWLAVTELVNPSCLPLLSALNAPWLERGFDLPEVGYELGGSRDEVLVEAELAWPDQQLAVILDPADAPVFEAAGWRCWPIDDSPDQLAATLLSAL
jgi:DEAD/DEAH box helicase domain-containing protein